MYLSQYFANASTTKCLRNFGVFQMHYITTSIVGNECISSIKFYEKLFSPCVVVYNQIVSRKRCHWIHLSTASTSTHICWSCSCFWHRWPQLWVHNSSIVRIDIILFYNKKKNCARNAKSVSGMWNICEWLVKCYATCNFEETLIIEYKHNIENSPKNISFFFSIKSPRSWIFFYSA